MSKIEVPAIVADPPLSTPIVLLTEEAVAEANELIRRCDALELVNDDNFEAANADVGKLTAFEKKLERNRVAVKAAPWSLCKQIDAAAGSVSGRIEQAKRRAAKLVGDHLRRKRDAAERAEADRQRKIEEARRAAEEAAKLEANTEADIDAREELVEQTAVVPLPATWAAPVTKGGSVHLRSKKELVIGDWTKIPHTINGVALLEVKHGAIKRMLESGIAVPECELVDVDAETARATS
jgi:hypothetical protein